jgi:hypothetical protein
MPVFTNLEDALVAQLMARKAAGCEKSAASAGRCLASVLSGTVKRSVRGEAAETSPADAPRPAPPRE